jgi:hypothetical protein
MHFLLLSDVFFTIPEIFTLVCSLFLKALIIIVAPRRGRTLALFLDLVQRDGTFDIEVFDEEFDIDVTFSHKKVEKKTFKILHF